MTERKPEFWFLTGPNGAGKSTLAPYMLGEFRAKLGSDFYYFNPDQAGKVQGTDAFAVMERFYNTILPQLRRERRDVLVEIAKPGGGSRNLILDLRQNGYKTGVIAIGVPTFEMASQNVAKRVAGGGHDVFPNLAEIFYNSGRDFLPEFMAVADEVQVYDNRGATGFVKTFSCLDRGEMHLHVPIADLSADKNPYMHALVLDLRARGMLPRVPLRGAEKIISPGCDC